MTDFLKDSYGKKSAGRLKAFISLFAAIFFAMSGLIAFFFKYDISIYCGSLVTAFLTYSAGVKLAQKNIEKNDHSG